MREDRRDDLEATGLIEWVEEQARFEELAEGWERLAETQPYPFLRFDWLRCWWRAFAREKRLAICTAWEGGELTGVFPLCRRDAELEVMKNAHSPVYRPFARDEQTLRELVEAALEAAGGFLLVAHLPDGDPAIPMLVDAARRRGRVTLVERQHVSPIVQLEGFELERKTRKELARLGAASRTSTTLRSRSSSRRPISSPSCARGSSWRRAAGRASGTRRSSTRPRRAPSTTAS